MGMEDDILNDLKTRIARTLEDLHRDLTKIRTGRANLSILDGVKVDYYGTATPLHGVATLHVADARLITIKPWDKKQIGAIERGIQQADLGLTPQNDGELIRLPIPPLTQERRKEYVKMVKSRAEDHRVAIRNERRDARELLTEMEKEGDLAEDDAKHAMEKVQAVVDQAIVKVDEIAAKKEKELLEI